MRMRIKDDDAWKVILPTAACELVVCNCVIRAFTGEVSWLEISVAPICLVAAIIGNAIIRISGHRDHAHKTLNADWSPKVDNDTLMQQLVSAMYSQALAWQSLPIPDVKDATAFVADNDDYRFVLSEFSIEDQGFEPGTMGYDGMVVIKSGVPFDVVRLTRVAAKMGVDAAKATIALNKVNKIIGEN